MDSRDFMQVLETVGIPAAFAVAAGWMVWKLFQHLISDVHKKLDTQHGMIVALIDRVRSLDNEIIRQDTLIKTILGVPQLIDSNKIAKADRDDQRKD